MEQEVAWKASLVKSLRSRDGREQKPFAVIFDAYHTLLSQPHIQLDGIVVPDFIDSSKHGTADELLWAYRKMSETQRLLRESEDKCGMLRMRLEATQRMVPESKEFTEELMHAYRKMGAAQDAEMASMKLLKKHESHASTLLNQLTSSRSSFDELKQILAHKDDLLVTSTAQIGVLRKDIDSMHRTLLRREEEAKLLTSKSYLLSQEHDTLKRERSKTETELTSLRHSLKSRDSTISELQKAKQELQRTIDSLRSRSAHPSSKPIGNTSDSSSSAIYASQQPSTDSKSAHSSAHSSHAGFASATSGNQRQSAPAPHTQAPPPNHNARSSAQPLGRTHSSDLLYADDSSSSDQHHQLYSTDNGEIFKLTDGDHAHMISPPPETVDSTFLGHAALKPGELQRRIDQESGAGMHSSNGASIELAPGSLGRIPTAASKESAPISEKTKRTSTSSLSQIFAPFLPKSLTGSSSGGGGKAQPTKSDSPAPGLTPPPVGSKPSQTSTYGPTTPGQTPQTTTVSVATGSLFSYTRTTPAPYSPTYTPQEISSMNQQHTRAIENADTSPQMSLSRNGSQSSPPTAERGMTRSPSNSNANGSQLTSFGSTDNMFSSSFGSLPDDTMGLPGSSPQHIDGSGHYGAYLGVSGSSAQVGGVAGVFSSAPLGSSHGASPSSSAVSSPLSSASSSMVDVMVFDAAAEARLVEIQRRLDDTNLSSSSLGSFRPKSPSNPVKMPSKIQTTVQAGSKSKTSLLCLSVDPTGVRFIAGGEAPLSMYDALSGTSQRCFKGTSKTVTSVSWDEKGALLLATGTDNTCRVWFPGQTPPCAIHHAAEVQMGCFLSQTRIATIARNRMLSIFDISYTSSSSSYKFVRSTTHKSTAYALCVNPLTAIVYTGHLDKQIRAYDPKRDATVSSFDSQHTDAITGLQISPDGSKLYSTSRDGSIRCFDVDSGNKLLAVYTAPKLSIQSNWARATLSPSGEYIALGSATGQIFIWDTATTKIIANLKASSVPITGVSWNPLHSNHLVSFDETGSISIWC